MSNLDRDVRKWIKKVERTVTVIKFEEIFKEAGNPLREAMKNNIKVSNRTVKRYSNGKVVAEYHSGNLRRSVRFLKFGRRKRNKWTPKNVFVGVKVAKRGKGKGVFKGNRVDGYYAHLVEFGSSKQVGQGYMRKAVDSTKNTVKKKIITEVQKQLAANKRKNGIT